MIYAMINSLRLRAQDAQSKTILLLVAGLAIGTHGAAPEVPEPGAAVKRGDPFGCDLELISHNGRRSRGKISVGFNHNGNKMIIDVEMQCENEPTNIKSFRTTANQWEITSHDDEGNHEFKITAIPVVEIGSHHVIQSTAPPEKDTLIVRASSEHAPNIMRQLSQPGRFAPFRKWLAPYDIQKIGGFRWECNVLFIKSTDGENEIPKREVPLNFEIDYIPAGTSGFSHLPFGAVLVMRNMSSSYYDIRPQNEFIFPMGNELSWDFDFDEHDHSSGHLMEVMDIRPAYLGITKKVTLYFIIAKTVGATMKALQNNPVETLEALKKDPVTTMKGLAKAAEKAAKKAEKKAAKKAAKDLKKLLKRGK